MPNIIMNPPQVYMCSTSWTLLPPPSPYHPSGSSQCTSPKHPVSCIEPGLATRFIHDILHVWDITFSTKVHIIEAMIFPVVMYKCEIQALRKAEHQRTDYFEMWCYRWLFRVPWTARISNQSILKEINPEYTFEGLMLKLNELQYFGHLMQRTN